MSNTLPVLEGLEVVTTTLRAHRPGRSLSVDRLNEPPNEYLRDHGAYTREEAYPVVVMLDEDTDGSAIDTVAFAGDDDSPLESIERAVRALALAAEALVATGHVDYCERVTRADR